MPTDPDVRLQLALFETGIDPLLSLLQKRNALAESTLSENTERAYAAGWQIFTRWCESVRRSPIPASLDTVTLFITWAYEQGYRRASVSLLLSCIRAIHRRAGERHPCGEDAVRDLMRQARRKIPETKGGKDALTIDLFTRLVRKLDPSDPVDVLQRAVLTFTWFACLRRSETCALDLSNIELVRRGIILDLGATKGDQDDQDPPIGIPYFLPDERICPVRAMKAWLQIRGHEPGALFNTWGSLQGRGRWRRQILPRRLNPERIITLVKELCKRAGLDPKRYGSHSLRSGLITTATDVGTTPSVIMQRSRHRSIQVMHDHYVRSRPFASDPLQALQQGRRAVAK
jgi:integrase